MLNAHLVLLSQLYSATHKPSFNALHAMMFFANQLVVFADSQKDVLSDQRPINFRRSKDEML
jgi:hypothetical protein